MLAKAQIPNPHYPGSPARMSDGRLFTDYRPSCSLLGPADFDSKQRLQETGIHMISADRSTTVMRAGTVGCVDTMVPELSKRVCTWNGCKTLPAHSAGIGQGRLYLPGRQDLVAEDTDLLAAATAFDHGTFSANPNSYMANLSLPWTKPSAIPAIPAKLNRYSAPYG
jgi:hypothetical protein